MSEVFKIEVPKFPSRKDPDFVKNAREAAARMQQLANKLNEGRSGVENTLSKKSA